MENGRMKQLVLSPSEHIVGCDMGECGRLADFTLRFSRLGPASNLHFCRQCLTELYEDAGAYLVPKSPANAFGRYEKKEVVGELKDVHVGAPEDKSAGVQAETGASSTVATARVVKHNRRYDSKGGRR